jgi:magnesium chelatase subunit H
VPYLAAHPVEFQTLEQWQASERGLMPVEATMMVAIPELDGSTGPMVFGGRSAEAPQDRSRDMQPHPERANALAPASSGWSSCARRRRRSARSRGAVQLPAQRGQHRHRGLSVGLCVASTR